MQIRDVSSSMTKYEPNPAVSRLKCLRTSRLAWWLGISVLDHNIVKFNSQSGKCADTYYPVFKFKLSFFFTSLQSYPYFLCCFSLSISYKILCTTSSVSLRKVLPVPGFVGFRIVFDASITLMCSPPRSVFLAWRKLNLTSGRMQFILMRPHSLIYPA